MSIKESIENLQKEVKELNVEDTPELKNQVISIPLSENYKKRFDELQSATGRKFGKLLQEVIKKAIDSVA